jgi:hypothetical protein
MRETRDNIVASFVDIGSMFLAYRIGVAQLGVVAGLAYGILDAWLVIWQRKRIAEAVHRFLCFFRIRFFKRRDALPWIVD